MIQRLINLPRPTFSGHYTDLKLRTKDVTSQTMQIDIQANHIRFRKKRALEEIYLVSAINHVPSFVYDLTFCWDTVHTVNFIAHQGRGSSPCDRMGNDRVRRLFGSIDGIRDMCNRIIDDEAPLSANTTGDPTLRHLMSIDAICFVERGQASAVDFDMYRRAAFSNRLGYLDIVFEHMKRICSQACNHYDVLNQEKSFALLEPDLFTTLKKDLLEDQDDHNHVLRNHTLERVEWHIGKAEKFVARHGKEAAWYRLHRAQRADQRSNIQNLIETQRQGG